MNIGLLGGTFNPVHFGHLQLADAAMAECSLDQVVFIPSSQPPHKDEASIAPFVHRIAMLQIAGRNTNRFSCTSIESELPTPSYTIDTLRAMSVRYPADARFFFIIGADAFLDLLSWKAYDEILRCVTLIVAERKGYHSEKIYEFLNNLQYVDHVGYWWRKNGESKIILLHTMPGNYSSTAIRAKIGRGIFPENEMPDGVIEYIKKHSLYRTIDIHTERCVCMD
jgi:nicotinate-nucleotide adenylyltransferase